MGVKNNYRDTLNLPKTDFPMRAGLPKKEPELLAQWDEAGLYRKIQEKNAGRPRYILHDGPPYANGNIHIGHALNKILKDFIVKYKNMRGFASPYVPGWDCHGLPIEHKVAKLWKENGKSPEDDITAFRAECRRYAEKYIGIQKAEFQRLGVLGDWDRHYYTMDFAYEAAIAREFGKFVGEGFVYEGKKPVYWCADCKTALAEAEVEYHDHATPSIYVKFKLVTDVSDKIPELKGRDVSVVIWTTTPWTIPANLGLMFHPEYDYAAIDAGEEVYIMAERLAPVTMDLFGIKDWKKLAAFKAGLLEGAKAKHPFIDRESLVVLADFVTLETGTGVVHTAPGHGQEDYEVGRKYGLDVYAPVDAEGKFTADVPEFEGQFVFAANPNVNALLKEKGALLHQQEMTHSYPHCWRCKQPILFRAARQWFVSIDNQGLRGRLLEEIDNVNWVPHWGKNRIVGMVQNRPDWCISRQRAWGNPVMAFRCADCGEAVIDKGIIDRIADLFEKEGADAWFNRESADLLPDGASCPKCSGPNLTKTSDILDVWFDSGVSHAAVCEKDEKLGWPVDLYLEGSDQHRGWFNSALTTAVATRGKAPYGTVLTHGFVMSITEADEQQDAADKKKSAKYAKMSKSLGNVVSPQDVIEKYGADILRLWVSAEDYRDDTRIGDEILKRLSDAYRRIRNTWRFLLGNLADFDPAKDSVKKDALFEIDRWILHRLQELIERTQRAYEKFEFHVIYQAVHNFCAVDLSAVYLDVLKDRMYCSAPNSPARRAGQTAMFGVLDATLRLMAPVLSFTAEEAYRMLPGSGGKSVHLQAMPEADDGFKDEALAKKWARLLDVRSEVNRTIEALRADKTIGQNLDATVELAVPDDLRADLESLGGGAEGEEDLRRLLIVSKAVLVDDLAGDGVLVSELVKGLKVRTTPNGDEKCPRCWNRETTIGSDPKHADVCERCARELSRMEGV